MMDSALLKTAELQARIELELGIVVDSSTIRSWTLREDHPLPVAYKGKNGQAHKFVWSDFLAWYHEDLDRQPTVTTQGDPDLDQIDWHTARTISQRERAKRDILETRKLEGRYVDAEAVSRAAEDRARHAVGLLRTIPSRMAPQLAMISDELEIDRLLDAEIRAVCSAIERDSLAALEADLDAPQDPHQ